MRGLLLGSLVADAIAMPVHWIYNPSKIRTAYGRIDSYVGPAHNKYHSTRQKGDLCHYGDQVLELMRSIGESGGFHVDHFSNRWRSMWENYSGYVDGATRDTLKNLEQGARPMNAGSESNDLSGASRIAPVVVATLNGGADSINEAARIQTLLTHNDGAVIEAAEYFATLLLNILNGHSLSESMGLLAERHWDFLNIRSVMASNKTLLPEPTDQALGKLGLTCHFPDAFPATLYLLQKYPDDFPTAVVENAMAGGDSTARGLILGAVLGALHGESGIPADWLHGMSCYSEVTQWLTHRGFPANDSSNSDNDCGCDNVSDAMQQYRSGTLAVKFQNAQGITLDARLEMPEAADKPPVAFAIFAHCFTCSKDILAAARISRELTRHQVAVLRFDFTGIGDSGGDFSDTSFTSNVDDLVAAGEYLRQNYQSPEFLIGHSLGGAAVIAAVNQIPGIRGLVTLAAPSDPEHVQHLFADRITELETDGKVTIQLGGKSVTIGQEFLNDIRNKNILKNLQDFQGATLIMHAPGDSVVSVNHAGKIFSAANHPRSFIAVDGADHLLSRKKDSIFVADIIGAWVHHLI